MDNTTFTATADFNSRDFTKIKELEGAYAFVFIPHQMPASSAVYFDKKQVIDVANKVTQRSSYLSFSSFTVPELMSCYGEDEFAKDEDGDYINEQMGNAMDIAVRKGKVYAVNGEWLEQADEFEWACDALCDDLNSARIFDNLDDAIEWMTNYTGHQAGRACMALAEALEASGFIESVEE